MICNAFATREALAIASRRVHERCGFPLFVTDPQPEWAIAEAMIGGGMSGLLHLLAEGALETPQFSHTLRLIHFLRGPLRASSQINAWEDGWETHVARFGASIGVEFERKSA